MAKPIGAGGKAVLTIGNMAGMIDMVALPLWIGVLMQHYQFSPQQAGITATLFLLGVVVASAVAAPLFNRLPRRWVATCGFALAAVSFLFVAQQPLGVASFDTMALLHVLAGLGTGFGLSLVHGCIGRTDNPHRLFGLVNLSVAIMGIVFYAAMPGLIARHGGAALFSVIAAAMAVGAAVSLAAFPDVGEPAAAPVEVEGGGKTSRLLWMPIGVVICLALNQAMVFAFVERVGASRGFAAGDVQAALVAVGFVNLLPGPAAAWMQHRLSPLAVGVAGPIYQAVLALTLSASGLFGPYALATAVYVCAIIFTHTFLFGLMTRLDPTGRAVSATPAMMMIGSCLGPALGGFIVAAVGYPGLGWAACAVSAIAVALMLRLRALLRVQVGSRAGAFA